MKLPYIFLASTFCVMSLSAYESSSYSNSNPNSYQYQGTYGGSFGQSQGGLSSDNQYNSSQSPNRFSSNQNIPNDNELSKKIQDELNGGMFGRSFKNVKFQLRSQGVTLTGWVESDNDLHTIMERVAKIKGLRRIDNQVQVKPAQKANTESSSSSY